MLDYSSIDVFALVIVALVYALFDVLNKRNVPNAFAYGTVILGIALALIFNYSEIYADIGIAAIVGIVGYVVYRAGFIGAGDIFEFVFITLALPLQQMPLLLHSLQFNIPFIVSVIIGAGYTAMIFIPIYYLGIKIASGKVKIIPPTKDRVRAGAFFCAAYLIFAALLYYTVGFDVVAYIIVFVLLGASLITIIYEMTVYKGMVAEILPKNLEEGDMIATNLMSRSDLKYFSKYEGFGRLATKSLISEMKGTGKKLPVYRDSVPFSLFIFFGVIISLLFGNMILIIVGV